MVDEQQGEYDEEMLGKFMKRSLPRVLQAVVENETSLVIVDMFFLTTPFSCTGLFLFQNKEATCEKLCFSPKLYCEVYIYVI